MILDAVGEFAPDHVSRLEKLKKAEIASEAERLVQGSGWMPALFRVEGSQDDAIDTDEPGAASPRPEPKSNADQPDAASRLARIPRLEAQIGLIAGRKSPATRRVRTRAARRRRTLGQALC